MRHTQGRTGQYIFIVVAIALSFGVIFLSSAYAVHNPNHRQQLAEACDNDNMDACRALLPIARDLCEEDNECRLLNTLQYKLESGGQGNQRQGQSGGIDANQSLPCMFYAASTPMISGNLALVPCARLIAASGGRGKWGQNNIQVDQNSMIYVNGKQYGVARNESGTVGTYQQRCMQGDTEACEAWQRGSQRGIDYYNRRQR